MSYAKANAKKLREMSAYRAEVLYGFVPMLIECETEADTEAKSEEALSLDVPFWGDFRQQSKAIRCIRPLYVARYKEVHEKMHENVKDGVSLPMEQFKEAYESMGELLMGHYLLLEWLGLIDYEYQTGMNAYIKDKSLLNPGVVEREHVAMAKLVEGQEPEKAAECIETLRRWGGLWLHRVVRVELEKMALIQLKMQDARLWHHIKEVQYEKEILMGAVSPVRPVSNMDRVPQGGGVVRRQRNSI